MEPPFLGRGWSFPPMFDPTTRQVKLLDGEADIQSSLYVLLSTLPGERVMQPTFGCDLTPLLFQPLDTTLRTYLQDKIRTAILYHEPRIDVVRVELTPNALEGLLLIELDYTVRATNSRHNVVFPYYRSEGSEVAR
jgi:hypothetical protein